MAMAAAASSTAFSPLVFLLFFFLLLLASPSTGQSCEDVANDKTYENCTTLTQLNCRLQWSLSPSTSTSVLKMKHCCPRNGGGWIAWAINPEKQAMIGSQAFLGLFQDNGSASTMTSNITDYTISNTSILYKLSDMNIEAKSAGRNVCISATWNLPGNITYINQIWQLGPLGRDGTPAKHKMEEANMKAMAVLNLTSSGSPGTPNSPPPSSKPSSAPPLLSLSLLPLCLSASATVLSTFALSFFGV